MTTTLEPDAARASKSQVSWGDDWQKGALCAQTDPDAFYPEKGGSTRNAKRVCLSCDVRDECLEFALLNNERFGIWGGKSERERRRIARDRGLEAYEAVAEEGELPDGSDPDEYDDVIVLDEAV